MIRVLLIILAVLGVVDATAITWMRLAYGGACVGGDCYAVLTSSWSTLWGLPLSIYGLALYLWILLLAVRGSTLWIFTLSLGGTLFSGYLLYLQAFVIESWCLYCVFSAGIQAALLALSATDLKRGPALLTGVCSLVVALGVHQLLMVSRDLYFQVSHANGTLEVGMVDGRVYTLAEVDAAIGAAPAEKPERLFVRRITFLQNELIRLASGDQDPDAYLAEYIRTHAVDPAEGRENLLAELQDKFVFYMKVPLPPKLSVVPNPGGDIIVGNPDAPVTVIEFADFECGSCRAMHARLSTIMSRYPNKIKWVFRHLPHPKVHRGSREKAIAATCAFEQGAFKEYAQLLFRNQRAPASPQQLLSWAENLKMDRKRFQSCLERTEARSFVQEDMEEATRLGISITPTLIINGRVWQGFPTTQQWREIMGGG